MIASRPPTTPPPSRSSTETPRWTPARPPRGSSRSAATASCAATTIVRPSTAVQRLGGPARDWFYNCALHSPRDYDARRMEADFQYWQEKFLLRYAGLRSSKDPVRNLEGLVQRPHETAERYIIRLQAAYADFDRQSRQRTLKAHEDTPNTSFIHVDEQQEIEDLGLTAAQTQRVLNICMKGARRFAKVWIDERSEDVKYEAIATHAVVHCSSDRMKTLIRKKMFDPVCNTPAKLADACREEDLSHTAPVTKPPTNSRSFSNYGQDGNKTVSAVDGEEEEEAVEAIGQSGRGGRGRGRGRGRGGRGVGAGSGRGGRNDGGDNNKAHLWCHCCKRSGHDIDECRTFAAMQEWHKAGRAAAAEEARREDWRTAATASSRLCRRRSSRTWHGNGTAAAAASAAPPSAGLLCHGTPTPVLPVPAVLCRSPALPAVRVPTPAASGFSLADEKARHSRRPGINPNDMFNVEKQINTFDTVNAIQPSFIEQVISADTQLPLQPQHAQRPFINVQVGRVQFPALYDTGASCNVMDIGVFHAAQREGKVKGHIPQSSSITTASGDKVPVTGVYVVETIVQSHPYTGPFLVLERSNPSQPIIIGMTAIAALKLMHDSATNQVSAVTASQQGISLAVFKKAKAEAGRTQKVQIQATRDGLPICNALLVAAVNGQDVLVESDDRGVFALSLSNRSGTTACWERRTHMGQAVLITEDDYDITADADAADLQIAAIDVASHAEAKKRRQAETGTTAPAPSSVCNAVAEAVKHLPPRLQAAATHHLLTNWSAISKDKFDLGLCKLYQHTIHLSDKTPVYHRQFPIPLDHQDTILENVEKWLQLGIVEPARSPYNSPIFCVRKKGGGFRMCLDYRGVNAKSLPENYNIRTPDDCISEVGQKGGKYFIALDLSSGFYQMQMAPESRPISAFTVPRYGQLQWTRAAMGLKGCPASFARMMDMVMQGIPNVITYIDDVLIYSPTPEGALSTLEAVLKRLRKHNLKVNLAKSTILAAKTNYLGHVLSSEGIAPGADKAQAILDAKPPHSVKQLKSFLGMINYFRSFVRHFAHQAGKLYALTRQDSPWKGGPLPSHALETFQLLKKEIAQATPKRKFPRREGKYHLYVDGSLGDANEEGGLGAHWTAGR